MLVRKLHVNERCVAEYICDTVLKTQECQTKSIRIRLISCETRSELAVLLSTHFPSYIQIRCAADRKRSSGQLLDLSSAAVPHGVPQRLCSPAVQWSQRHPPAGKRDTSARICGTLDSKTSGQGEPNHIQFFSKQGSKEWWAQARSNC